MSDEVEALLFDTAMPSSTVGPPQPTRKVGKEIWGVGTTGCGTCEN